MTVQELTIKNCEDIRQIDGTQYIDKAWREVDGKRQLISIQWQENDLPNGMDWHIKRTKETLAQGGFAFGCYEGNLLVGYGTVSANFFGRTAKYLLLDQLFLSHGFRGKGIGKALFLLCAKKAKEQGADKLYICAGSAEETIAFYHKIGCVEAQEINKELYEADPRDMQMEYRLD
ncbi:GNAT family N-acetyltransferase [Paludicola sp. MB14-C6]|uniref:GNAT family N-acetyltransferase n=1 Tax=Paludihabitans sp. MB14-C6 TaxID=3070656 RepID=UPI0027DE71B0|nr:GNAT family N-acetyltransferase [Paludicola sp. MB14-C6]WMJ24378.1 GNAT family N-acetyltransferase [Paludicola sp. MB14-C6]